MCGQIDVQRNLVYLSGSIPGTKGSQIEIKDSVKGHASPTPLPFPTISLDEIEQIPNISSRPMADKNPYDEKE